MVPNSPTWDPSSVFLAARIPIVPLAGRIATELPSKRPPLVYSPQNMIFDINLFIRFGS